MKNAQTHYASLAAGVALNIILAWACMVWSSYKKSELPKIPPDGRLRHRGHMGQWAGGGLVKASESPIQYRQELLSMKAESIFATGVAVKHRRSIAVGGRSWPCNRPSPQFPTPKAIIFQNGICRLSKFFDVAYKRIHYLNG